MTDDLNFHNTDTYDHNDNVVFQGIKAEAIKPPVEAFLANLNRLKSLHEIPLDVGIGGSHPQQEGRGHAERNAVQDSLPQPICADSRDVREWR